MSSLRTYLESLHNAVLGEVDGGQVPELLRLCEAREAQLGIAVCAGDGHVTSVGDLHEFPIQSISKAFAYGAALDHHGEQYVLERVDEEPSGEEFNAISIDPETLRPKNPLINIGAIRVHAMLGTEREERIERLRAMMDAAAGRRLPLHESTFEAEMRSADRNLALAHMMRAAEQMDDDPHEVVAGYTAGCSVLVTVEDLARMAATLAHGGVNPGTGQRVLSAAAAKQVMSVMLTCGMYDDAGDWMSDVGLPAKSGVGGGIIAALPPRLGFATYSPALDAHGNSVRGTAVFEHLSHDFGLHMLDGASVESLEAQAETLIRD